MNSIHKEISIIFSKIKKLINISICLFISSISLSNGMKLGIYNSNSEVIVTIKGTGTQQILTYCSHSDYFFYYPSQLIYNGNTKAGDIKVYNLQNDLTEVRIIFNQEIKQCNMMFYGLSNITKIDLSKFDSSKVTSMMSMFCECYSLTSVNFANFDTSLVTDMNRLFYRCYSLELLNINNFNTKSLIKMDGMFCECKSLKFLDLSSFNTSLVTSMDRLFFDCHSLTSLDVTSFNTSLVTIMQAMFYNCSNLLSIDIFNFNTKNVIDMFAMFTYCTSLTSLNVSNFDTSKVTNMQMMFASCSSLLSLDLDNFDTSSTIDMSYMFCLCQNLISLKLDNFNTGKVTTMERMFDSCLKLTTLELDSFDTSKVTNMNQMFYNCISLTALNLTNFNTLQVKSYSSIFEEINLNFIYCINEETTSTSIMNLLSKYNSNCSYFCFGKSQKYIHDTTKCIDNCEYDAIYKYEYNNICYQSCQNPLYYDYSHSKCIGSIPDGYYLNDTNLNTIDKCQIKCKNCIKDSKLKDLCISCDNTKGFFELYNDSSNQDSFVNCYNDKTDGYFLDNINNIYYPCYEGCKSCNGIGSNENNECMECFPDYIRIDNNCYKKCKYYYYFDSSNKYKCTQGNSCPDDYNKLIKERNQCIDNCLKDTIYIYEYNNICLDIPPIQTSSTPIKTASSIITTVENLSYINRNECSDNSHYIIIETGECSNNCTAFNYFNYICKIYSDETTVKDEMINTIKIELLEDEMKELIIKNVYNLNYDLIVSDYNMTFQITSSYNQNNIGNSNLSSIILGECEGILKDYYKLNEKDNLTILKIEKYEEGFLIPVIEYEVYNLRIKMKLDLNL